MWEYIHLVGVVLENSAPTDKNNYSCLNFSHDFLAQLVNCTHQLGYKNSEFYNGFCKERYINDLVGILFFDWGFTIQQWRVHMHII